MRWFSPAANRELQLLHWDGTSSHIVAEVKHAGLLYRLIELHSSVGSAITLPSHAEKYDSSSELFTGIRDQLLRFHNLDEESASLLTGALGSSWFVDCLPVVPCISIASPVIGDAVALLRHLTCYAHFPLVIGEPTQSSLQFLPADFAATLLIHHSELTQKTQCILNLAGYRGLSVPGRGRLFTMYGVMIVAGSSHPPLLGNAVRVALGAQRKTGSL